MKRIPLQIVQGRLILTSVIECPRLRIPKQVMEFVIDTGSPDSYISDTDVRKLQISIKDKPVEGEVDFGGSRYKQVALPKMKMYLLKEGKSRDYFTFNVSLSALKTTKISVKKMQAAQMLPSVLGLNFLKEQNVSLHVILSEDMAYLELEE